MIKNEYNVLQTYGNANLRQHGAAVKREKTAVVE